MSDKERVKAHIREAFARIEYPGDWCLRGSNEGDEPYWVEDEFRGKRDWQSLVPKFLDEAPSGLASALSFFSDEAFRFYLPAYLIADLDGGLECVDPVFHLTYGLDDDSKNETVNPKRYGERTWLHEATHKFAMFTRAQAAAIVEYLQCNCDSDDHSDLKRVQIEQALRNYWLARIAS
jgi:Family of unknown function (DUF6714)